MNSEEANLLYVAVTRAKHALIMSKAVGSVLSTMGVSCSVLNRPYKLLSTIGVNYSVPNRSPQAVLSTLGVSCYVLNRPYKLY